jgi:predicted MFS family arabinose efflux permease
MIPAPRLRLATVLTACAVVNVASIYLAQPLLPFIGETLDAGTSAMSVVQGGLQLGFGVGLVLFGILADTRERRQLLTVMAAGLCVSAAAAAVAPTYLAFLLASLGMGCLAAVLPVVIATAAAAGDRRALVGILSGAPFGVVLGRTLAGVLGQADWRLAFALSAVSAAALIVLVRTSLPVQPVAGTRLPVRRALGQMASLTRLPRNLTINLSNSVIYIGWSAVWTILAFLLKEPPFSFSAFGIGLVGLVGLGGAVSGQAGAYLEGRFGETTAARICLGVILVSALALAVSGEALVPLLVALFLYNAAVWVLQAVNIPAAARRAGPERAARGTALAYLTNFICTAIGAVIGALVWNDLGWGGVGALAAVAAVVSIGFDLWGRGMGSRRTPEPVREIEMADIDAGGTTT